MSNYTTIVIRVPKDAAGMRQVFNGLKYLEPYQTGISLEDELTFLDCLMQHEDFDQNIAEDARQMVAELHARQEQELAQT